VAGLGERELDFARAGRGKRRDEERRELEKRKGKTIKMTRYVTWEPQPRRVTRRGSNQLCSTSSYFSESLFIGTDLDRECGRTIEMRQFEYMSIGRQIAVSS
jgi:hypothetical protein